MRAAGNVIMSIWPRESNSHVFARQPAATAARNAKKRAYVMWLLFAAFDAGANW